MILEPQKIKSATVSTVPPSISHEVMGPDAMIFVFWMLSFKPTFSLSSFTFIKRLFSSSSLSVIRVVSSAYLRLLMFLPAILIPACASSRPAFLMMYSAYKLNKQGDNIQPWCTPFPIWEFRFYNYIYIICYPLPHLYTYEWNKSSLKSFSFKVFFMLTNDWFFFIFFKNFFDSCIYILYFQLYWGIFDK